jgi:hypothetical protein
MFHTQMVEKIKTTFYVNTLFSENRAAFEIMWKNMIDLFRSQIQYNTAHALCMMDK